VPPADLWRHFGGTEAPAPGSAGFQPALFKAGWKPAHHNGTTSNYYPANPLHSGGSDSVPVKFCRLTSPPFTVALPEVSHKMGHFYLALLPSVVISPCSTSFDMIYITRHTLNFEANIMARSWFMWVGLLLRSQQPANSTGILRHVLSGLLLTFFTCALSTSCFAMVFPVPLSTVMEKADFVGIVKIKSVPGGANKVFYESAPPTVIATPTSSYKGNVPATMRIVWSTWVQSCIFMDMKTVKVLMPVVGDEYMVFLNGTSPGVYKSDNSNWGMHKLPRVPNATVYETAAWRGIKDVTPYIAVPGERIQYRSYNTNLANAPSYFDGYVQGANNMMVLDMTRKRVVAAKNVTPPQRRRITLMKGASTVETVDISENFDVSGPGEYLIIGGQAFLRFIVSDKITVGVESKVGKALVETSGNVAAVNSELVSDNKRLQSTGLQTYGTSLCGVRLGQTARQVIEIHGTPTTIALSKMAATDGELTLAPNDKQLPTPNYNQFRSIESGDLPAWADALVIRNGDERRRGEWVQWMYDFKSYGMNFLIDVHGQVRAIVVMGIIDRVNPIQNPVSGILLGADKGKLINNYGQGEVQNNKRSDKRPRGLEGSEVEEIVYPAQGEPGNVLRFLLQRNRVVKMELLAHGSR